MGGNTRFMVQELRAAGPVLIRATRNKSETKKKTPPNSFGGALFQYKG